MTEDDLTSRYNYDVFTPEKFIPWLRFDSSPSLGEKAPDFRVWDLNETEVQLSDIWKKHLYTIVEFGSFT